MRLPNEDHGIDKNSQNGKEMVDNKIDQGSIKSKENREHKQKLVLAGKEFQKRGCVYVAMRSLTVAIDARNIYKLFF